MSFGTVQAEKMTTESGYSLGAGNASSFKNRLINGAMTIDQRNAGASFTNSNQNILGLDRWRNYGLSGAVLTIQQSTTAPTGFSNSQSVTVTTSTTANDSGGLAQLVEANNAIDLAWGTSSGKSVTMSFWVRGSVTGTYNVFFTYTGPTIYYYVATYTIDSANTWEYKTITVAAPPTAAGAFANALNTAYLTARFTISSSGGSSQTANTWSTSSLPKSSGCVDLASNAGATFFVTGVQFEVGTVATSFDFRSIGTELALCQRYTQAIRGITTANTPLANLANIASTRTYGAFWFGNEMRASPTASFSSANLFTTRNNSGSGLTVTSISASNLTTYSCELDVSVASGLNAGDSSSLGMTTSTSALIIFSAEL